MTRGLVKLTLIQAKLFVREPAAFFFTLIFPTILLLVFGSIFGSEPLEATPGFKAVDAMAPAYMTIILGSVAFMGLPIATSVMREMKVLKRFYASPLHPGVYVSSEVIVNLAMAFAGALIMVVVGVLAFDLKSSGQWHNIIGGFLLTALAFFALGYFIGGMSPTARIAQTLGMVIFFPAMFLSGATIPLEVMPDTVRRIAELLPMTYAVKLLQGLWFGDGWGLHLKDTLVLLATLAFGLAGTPRAFRWE